MPVAADDATPMFPLVLDVTALPIFAIGGVSLPSRVAVFDEHKARHVHVFSPEPPADLVAIAGARLERRWPEEADFAAHQPKLVFIADVEDAFAAVLRDKAKAVGALVHVQDRVPLCDFHLPARIRRGHLQVTVSTDGTAAGLARHIRAYLEDTLFGPEWADRVEELAAARRKWKQEGLTMADLGKAVGDFVAARGWLKKP
jgi:precorrin-2 dehydrogenase/sirohydrochlorin ferrochelatase